MRIPRLRTFAGDVVLGLLALGAAAVPPDRATAAPATAALATSVPAAAAPAAAATNTTAHTDRAPPLPGSLTWSSSGPLIAPKQDAGHPVVSVKDPTVFRYRDSFTVHRPSGRC
ncbi:hypothetical protein [Streptomyces avermitilis]|uniref:hypothetical protein n=1 Tax=Streptomyces avermitilis TaxID=33903 RepID=UPI003827C313